MRIMNRSLHRFATLNAQALANKNKNSVRFETPNLSWDFEVVDYHCKAFGKGLKQSSFGNSKLFYKVDDNILIKVPPSQQA